MIVFLQNLGLRMIVLFLIHSWLLDYKFSNENYTRVAYESGVYLMSFLLVKFIGIYLLSYLYPILILLLISYWDTFFSIFFVFGRSCVFKSLFRGLLSGSLPVMFVGV